MALTCARCNHLNPANAQYCFFDGVSLVGASGSGQGKTASFPAPFVLPSGQSCHSFDELARACHQHWQEARDLLKQGFLASFLGGLGRSDLAQAAQQAAAFPDPDRGLDQLLGRLPTQVLAAPKLRAEPQEINLGELRPNREQHFELEVANQGMRLLCGQIVSASDWLAVGASESGVGGKPAGAGQAQRLFQCLDHLQVPVQVRTHLLRAGTQSLEGKLVIESNGGTATIKVKALVPIRPFPTGVLAGATAPRQIAEKAKAHPKEAADLFEKGAVARWYEDNGWTCPVQEPAASGLGAVQQFFEALGLVKPPKVEVSETRIQLQGQPGERVRHVLQVRTSEKRPVFAHGSSNQPWLVVSPPQPKGTIVHLPLEATVPEQGGAPRKARVRVQANGNQRFDVEVTLTVAARTKAAAAVTAAPVLAADFLPDEPAAASGTRGSRVEAKTEPPAKEPARTRGRTGLNGNRSAFDFDEPNDQDRARDGKSRGSSSLVELPSAQRRQRRSIKKHALPALLLLLLLAGASIRDIYGPDKKVNTVIAELPEVTPAKNMETRVTIEDEPDENRRLVGLASYQVKIEDEPQQPGTGGPGKVKVQIKDEPDEVAPGTQTAPVDPRLRVLYHSDEVHHWGLVDAFNRKKLTYAESGSTNTTIVRLDGYSMPFTGVDFGLGGTVQQKKLPDDPVRQTQKGTSVTWQPAVKRRPTGLEVTQLLEIIPNRQPTDVGDGKLLRRMDTLLVRYVLKNLSRSPLNAGLRVQVDTFIGENDGVPFTVPGQPGLVNTLAQFLRPEEVPDFIQALETGDLRQPGTIVHVAFKVGGGVEAPGQVYLCQWKPAPTLDTIRPEPMGVDSAVVMAWPDRPLMPGERREVGYAYGLGALTAGDAKGKLAMTLGGNFDIGQSFTITAYVKNPVKDQTLTLELPPGLERIKGNATERVQLPRVSDTSIVTWQARVQSTGSFPIRVHSSTGVTQTKTVAIDHEGGPGGKLDTVLRGDFEPGQVFDVLTTVTDPSRGQALTLSLPPGLERTQGEATQPLPPAVGGKGQVRWQVLVQRPGRYPIRVQSSTGGAQTRTLTIEQGQRPPGHFFFTFKGDITPGQDFTIRAKVFNPVQGQKLSLVLPAGLKVTRGPLNQAVPPPGDDQTALVQWQVQVERAGKFPIIVRSTPTGREQKKTINLAAGDNLGRFEFLIPADLKLGKEFTVLAKVNEPVAGQTLTLDLTQAPGLELKSGPNQQKVPPVPSPGHPSTVGWNVLLKAPGTRVPVRIQSSTGLTRTKTLTIKGEDGTGQLFR